MARPWRSHVDYGCPDCGDGLVLAQCADHNAPDESRLCRGCGEPTRLVGIGGSQVGGARWYRCPACDQLHMLRRGEFVKTGERSGSKEFGSFVA
jgi:predicted RNA-binding Zn-ribbon protein involved in translation (DUF1610 family)